MFRSETLITFSKDAEDLKVECPAMIRALNEETLPCCETVKQSLASAGTSRPRTSRIRFPLDMVRMSSLRFNLNLLRVILALKGSDEGSVAGTETRRPKECLT